MNGRIWQIFENEVVDGRYHLVRLLGAGQYGGVYFANEGVGDRVLQQVAVKLVERAVGKESDRQWREVQAAQFNHPGLMRILTAGFCTLKGVNFLYIVMDLADESLATRLERGPLSPDETREMVLSLADALVFLHGQSPALVHRDIKPANILKVNGVWKLGDFGLLRMVNGVGEVSSTPGFGTPAYASPEAYENRVIPARDVWSLGMVIVEALTGRLPYPFHDLEVLRQAVIERGKPVPIPPLPEPFASMVSGCLEKEEKKRWGANQLVAAMMSPIVVHVHPLNKGERVMETSEQMAMAANRIIDFAKQHGLMISDIQKHQASVFGTTSYCAHVTDGKGIIYCHTSGDFNNGVFYVRKGIGWYYKNILRGSSARIGLPVSNELSVDGGSRSDFEGGSIFWSSEYNEVIAIDNQNNYSEVYDTYSFMSQFSEMVKINDVNASRNDFVGIKLGRQPDGQRAVYYNGLTIRYKVSNLTKYPVRVWLGASLISEDGIEYVSPKNDIRKTIEPSESVQDRRLDLPNNFIAGKYKLITQLWTWTGKSRLPEDSRPISKYEINLIVPSSAP